MISKEIFRETLGQPNLAKPKGLCPNCHRLELTRADLGRNLWPDEVSQGENSQGETSHGLTYYCGKCGFSASSTILRKGYLKKAQACLTRLGAHLFMLKETSQNLGDTQGVSAADNTYEKLMKLASLLLEEEDRLNG